MKKVQAKRILDEVFFRFGQQMATIRFESQFTVASFKDAHKKLSQLKELSQGAEVEERKLFFRQMWTAVSAMDILESPPVYVAISGKEAQDEELIEILTDNLNNQNRWLLVSAYEEFERYCRDIYGALGYLDRNLWRCEDFGSISLQGLKFKDLSWYQQCVRKGIGRYNTDIIIKRFRQIFPKFEKAESKNSKNNADLKTWINILAFLRNRIVHTQAKISKSEIIQVLQEKTGLSFTGHKRSVAMRRAIIFERLFKLNGNQYEIKAIDRSKLKEPYVSINNPFYFLLERIVSHASLSYKLSMKHFGQQAFWNR